MKSKQTCLLLIMLFFLINGYLFSLASSQNVFFVTLSAPSDDTTISTWNCNFTYVPMISGSDYFVNATLVINGTATTASNQTAIQNSVPNKISYTFTSNGTYLWNVAVYNSTNVVFASVNNTLTVSVAPEPTPTPIPSPTPTPTPLIMPSPTPAPTATPTEEPTPTPTATPTTQPFTVDGSLIVIVVLIVLAGILAAVIVLLWKKSR